MQNQKWARKPRFANVVLGGGQECSVERGGPPAPTPERRARPYVKNTGSQGSANGFGQLRRSGAKVRPAGRSPVSFRI